jgi:hypothetical protein
MREVEQHAMAIAREVLKREISVTFANDAAWPFSATYGPGRLTFNVGRLGRKWFSLARNRKGINALLIHEFGHEYSSDHLSEDYHDALCRIGADLVEMAAKQEPRHTLQSPTMERP